MDHRVDKDSRVHKNFSLETNNITSLLKTRKFIAIIHPINQTNESRFHIDFLFSRVEYVGILCNKLFPSDDGIINKISSNDNANAQYHTYSYPSDVGKNRHKNIRTTMSIYEHARKDKIDKAGEDMHDLLFE